MNFEEGVASPVLNGIGLGSDAIQCGDGQPDSCRAWVYWGHVGNQLVTAGLFLGDNEPDMSADEFRWLIDELLDY